MVPKVYFFNAVILITFTTCFLRYDNTQLFYQQQLHFIIPVSKAQHLFFWSRGIFNSNFINPTKQKLVKENEWIFNVFM